MKKSPEKWIIDVIYQRLGNVLVAIIGAVIFFILGSLISASIEFLYELTLWNVIDTMEEVVAGIATLIISVFCTSRFTSIASYFASRDFLPHLFNREKNRRSMLIGLPLLLIASYFQLLIYSFSPEILSLTVTQALSLLFQILLFALSVETMHFRYKQRKYLHRMAGLLLYVIVMVISIVAGVGFLYICVKYWSFWIIINLLVIGLVACLLLSFNYYYDYIKRELKVELDDVYLARPSKTVAFVLLSKFNKPTIRALSFAKAIHNNLELLSICYQDDDVQIYQKQIYQQYRKANLQIPLRIYKPQSNNFVSGAIEFLKSVQLSSSRELIVVYLPHYTSRHIFERILHNQASTQLIKQIEKIPNIVVATVPWQRT